MPNQRLNSSREINRIHKKLQKVPDFKSLVERLEGDISQSWLYDFLRNPRHRDHGIHRLERLERALEEL